MSRPVRKPAKKPRQVAIWLDLDWGRKREMETYAGCHRYGDEAGWECWFDPALERSLRTKPSQVPYDGVLGRVTPAIAKAAREAGIPVVNLWMNSPAKGVPAVFIDYRACGELAAEHLIERGYRQFGYLGHQRLPDCRQQLTGFRSVIREHGFNLSTYRFPHTLLDLNAAGWESFVAGLDRWLSQLKPPVGILIRDDLYGRLLTDTCRSKGLHVPEDVAIVGSGNEETICTALYPSLTSIDFGEANKGYRGAALLDRLMDGGPPPTQPLLVKPAGLVLRRSSDGFATNDPLVAKALSFIAANTHRALTVPAVLAEVGTSRRTLERRFRAELERSVMGVVLRLRLNRAKRRLVEADVPLKVVAQDSGFRTANHFSKVFHKGTGMSPSAYREHTRTGAPSGRG